jgi:hypothetical protein
MGPGEGLALSATVDGLTVRFSPARPRVVRDSRLDARRRGGHPPRRPVDAGAAALVVQGFLVAADGLLRAAVLGSSGRWPSRSRSRRRPRTSPSTPTRWRCCAGKSREERPSGARLAFYRAAMLVSGGVSITLAASIGWPAVTALLAVVFVLMLVLTWRSPEPDVQPAPPPTLRDAALLPWSRALDIRRGTGHGRVRRAVVAPDRKAVLGWRAPSRALPSAPLDGRHSFY